MLIRQIEVGRLSVFAYLLGEEGGEGLVIDPADEVDKIIALARSKKITIRTLVNTHAHVDHIMGNEELKQKTGARIVIHEAEAPLLTGIPQSLLAMFGARPSPPADQTVTDGDVLRVGEFSLKVLHTPGHSPGAICLHGEGAVFTGDTLFVGGLGRTDLPGGSWPVLLASIRTKLLTLPGETAVYPGHNYGSAPRSTIRNERLFNPFLK